MASQSSSRACSDLNIGESVFRFVDLPGLLGLDNPRVPFVLRILLENAVRHGTVAEGETAVARIRDWLKSSSSDSTIEFRPARILMEDTTSTPAFVDVAAMRDVVLAAGGDPRALNPIVPIDASMDHSLTVEHFATRNAARLNLRRELERNRERYAFLRWASEELGGVRIHPPGTGIMHTLNLEQLTTVVRKVSYDSGTWAIPDTVIGTDSHTPLINGVGVLGWGVGGLEAQAIMFGSPIILRIPNVVGVRLSGSLRAGILATDLALEVTHRLRAAGISGEFVEFFGSGVPTLSVGERCVVASMAPEYGATTGYFPVDERTLSYLQGVGRSSENTELVRRYMQTSGLWFDPKVEPQYTQVVDIGLDSIRRRIAGPRRPQDSVEIGGIPAALAEAGHAPVGVDRDLPRYPVAIAAITSCTNTTDPALLIAAGLVARKAREYGLQMNGWTKTSLGPGSPAAASYLARSGLAEDLSALGFDIVGFGCTTCIGNSGPLTEQVRAAHAAKTVEPVAVLSGNRNFPGRVHPDLNLSFIMSPPLVVAFALSGDAEIDFEQTPVQISPSGVPVYLHDLWPKPEEIAEYVKKGVNAADFGAAFAKATEDSIWNEIEAQSGPVFPWNAESTVLRRPPYVTRENTVRLGRYVAYPLMVLGDDVTTDHIAPGSAIPPASSAADFLSARGERRDDLGAFSSRRGNWEVMVRATFYNRSLRNLMMPDIPVGNTVHVPTRRITPIPEAAESYRRDGHNVVLVAGARYGTGSSRDWAAKGPWLLGVRAVLAVSIERIHRSNLIGMGILPLLLPGNAHPNVLMLHVGDQLEINSVPDAIHPRCPVLVRVLRATGEVEEIEAIAAIETEAECELLKSGGIIPSILRRHLTTSARQD
ncbi:aconitate hydratase AcnA [Paraburkholderia sediminicola]|uniref:aconitate hydratase AcnA n=1 Tax=Paraburkholderia sediminicola TaxID=458836 RepID=UPI0038BB4928